MQSSALVDHTGDSQRPLRVESRNSIANIKTDGETYVLLDKNGTLFAGDVLNATPYDLARFAITMLNDGVFNGQRVVLSSVIQALAKGGNISAFSSSPDGMGPAYGNGGCSAFDAIIGHLSQ